MACGLLAQHILNSLKFELDFTLQNHSLFAIPKESYLMLIFSGPWIYVSQGKMTVCVKKQKFELMLSNSLRSILIDKLDLFCSSFGRI